LFQAAIEQTLEDRASLLIEATSNHVNHYGDYSGMKSEDFRTMLPKLPPGFEYATAVLQLLYSGSTSAEWFFPQEKATFHMSSKGT
jgi:tagatose-1,6-bisphosphate aldolase non-catalytic subunit AgaZ/GatZ